MADGYARNVITALSAMAIFSEAGRADYWGLLRMQTRNHPASRLEDTTALLWASRREQGKAQQAYIPRQVTVPFHRGIMPERKAYGHQTANRNVAQRTPRSYYRKRAEHR